MLEPYRMVVVNGIAVLLLASGIGFYKYIYPKKSINLLVFLILISLLPLISLLRKGTYESGLLSENARVAFSFYDTLKEGIIAPMWSERACSGYGCPLFLFQYMLPFYITSFFHLLGVSILSSLKMMIAISFTSSGITMYFWAKSETDKIAGFIAALFYLFAPYHLATMHFRVSIGEILSFVFPPLILLCLKRIVESGKYKWIFLCSISLALLILSHQATSFIYMPFFAAYGLITYLRQSKKKPANLILCAMALLLGGFLTAYYWLPIIVEGKYIHLAVIKGVIFQPFWYYLYSPFQYRFGLLFQGHHGELYTNVGYIPYLILGISLILFLRRKISRKYSLLYLLLLTSFFIYFIMMQKITRPIWYSTTFLLNLQFTWRFLIQISLIISLIAAIVVKTINSNRFTLAIGVVVILITILNWGNRRTIPEITDTHLKKEPLYTEKPCDVELTTPIWVNTCAMWIGNYPTKPLESLSGDAISKQIERSSTKHSYVVDAKTDVLMKENTYYFPGWKVYANGKEIPINYQNKKFSGITTFSIKKGLYKIDVLYTKTTERIVGEVISVITLLSLLCMFIIIRIPRLNQKIRKIKNHSLL